MSSFWLRSIRPLVSLGRPPTRQLASTLAAAPPPPLLPLARVGSGCSGVVERRCGSVAAPDLLPRALQRSRASPVSALGAPVPLPAPGLFAGRGLAGGCGLAGGGCRGGVGSLGSSVRHFSTRNIRGRLFYKRRPKMIPIWKFNRKSKWLEGVGSRKGVCTKVYVMAPRKPNSGLRKVAYVRLSNGRIVKAYIPGIGHNLQVHSVVMVRGGAKKDTDGCNYTCMRGKYDLLPVKNRKSSRSKYGVTRPNRESRRSRFKGLTTTVDRRLYFYRTGEEVGPDEDVPQRIPYVLRTTAPFSYQHNSKKRPRAK